MPPLSLPGAPHRFGPSGEILCIRVQRLPRTHSGRTTIPHHFQYGGGCSDKSLGYGRGGLGVRNGRIWGSGPESSDVNIWGLCAPHRPSGSTALGSLGCSNRDVLLGHIEDQHEKTVGMTYQPCHIAFQHSEAAYERRMMGEDLSYWDRQKERIHFLDCSADLVADSLEAQFKSQHGIGRGEQWYNSLSPAELQIYQVSLTKSVGSVEFPVKICRVWATIHTNHQIHFVHCHVQ